MTMFNVSYRDLTFQALPHFLRKSNFLKLIFSAIKPLQTLNNDGVIVESFGQLNPSLYQFTLFIENFLRFDARTIYLERYLNDLYDPVARQINIVNNNAANVLYLFNDAEQHTPVYMFNNWDSTTAYIASPEDFAVEGNVVYQCIANNTNQQPPNATFWSVLQDIDYQFNFEDIFPFDYRIDIPLSVTVQPEYSDDRIKAQINLLNSASKTYEGVELGNITNQFFSSIE